MNKAANHIAIISTRLDLPGGIERITTELAGLLVSKGHNVSLIVADSNTGNNCFYNLNSNVRLLHLNSNFGITDSGTIVSRKFRLIKDTIQLKRLIRPLKTDIIITTEYHLSIVAVLAGLGKSSKLFSWEHHHYYSLKKNIFWKSLFNYAYPKLHTIVCLNAEESELFSKWNPHCVTIPNFTLAKTNQHGFNSHNTPFTILTIGHLNYTKGTDRLLLIAKKLLAQKPEIKWIIVGDGEMEINALIFIKENNLQDRIELMNASSNDVSGYYKAASIYVLTSRSECFPLTLLEAMQSGVPCIAYDCDTGPRYIIVNNENGLLIKNGDDNAMVNAILDLYQNEEKRKRMAERALAEATKYNPDKIYPLWEKLFNH
ncbi:MAG TPA: glycosyltransferase family 4 protein [Flavisolibacter sp.]|nr:glycosyltransferase family 4 protein [Flavisolibacter sp.]